MRGIGWRKVKDVNMVNTHTPHTQIHIHTKTHIHTQSQEIIAVGDFRTLLTP